MSLKSLILKIGSSEAEAEALETSSIKLSDVFEDYFSIIDKLKQEYFIVSGRKGSGKSAIAQYIHRVVSKRDKTLKSFLINLNPSSSDIYEVYDSIFKMVSPQYQGSLFESYYKWMIYSTILQDMYDNRSVGSQILGDSNLRKFLKANEAFIGLQAGEPVESKSSKSLEITTGSLFSLLGKLNIKYSKDFADQKVPFYLLVRNIEDLLIKALPESDYSYIVLFDDLDYNFSTSRGEDINRITSLISATKHINLNTFAAAQNKSKVIIMLRDDIRNAVIDDGSRNMSKVFESYNIDIEWYNQTLYNENNEDDIALKRFMNRRVSCALDKAGVKMSRPWEDIFSDKNIYGKSIFKYISDYTMLRPRDMILIFNKISEMECHVPISKRKLDAALKAYSEKLLQELRDEMSISLDKNSVDVACQLLRHMARMVPRNPSSNYNYRSKPIEYREIEYFIANDAVSIGQCSAPDIITKLYMYSAIGTFDYESKYFCFKYRKNDNTNFTKRTCFVLHKGLEGLA